MHRSIIHVDMDAFYASVEIRDNPALAGKPVVVGARPEQRGVVAAASYTAREYGIFSAMPSKTAIRLCPELIFVSGRHQYYGEISKQIRDIFSRYTPLIEPLSLDEAFLDVTGCERLWGSAEKIGRRIKGEISDELDLTASVGIAPNKFIAKLASDLDKPDGFVMVHPDQIQQVLDPLDVSKIWGVGKAGRKQLQRLGINTVKELRLHSPDALHHHFGKWGLHIWGLANGEDEREVVSDGDAKSISHETTFSADITELETLEAILLDLTEQVALRLRRLQRKARVVQIKIRYFDFKTMTRACTLKFDTDITQEIWNAANGLLGTALGDRNDPVRLLGIGVSELGEATGEQVDLFEQPHREQQKVLDHVADEINARFGSRAVHRGLKSPTD